MIKEITRLLDGTYFCITDEMTHGTFHGSRVELLVYLHECGFTDPQISLLLQVLDSIPPEKLLASRQGYC
jgi:hypothetical protein